MSARQDPVGEESVAARFLSAGWGANCSPVDFFILNLLVVHGV